MRRYILIIGCLLFGLGLKAQSPYACRYWFDENHEQSVTTTFSEGTWHMDLDVGHLSDGLHTVHLQVMDASMTWSVPKSCLFTKTSEVQADGMVYYCWFDEDYAHLRSDLLGDGHLVFDIPELETGVHTIHIMIQGGELSSPKTYLFLKTDACENDTLDMEQFYTYHCWFDGNYSTVQSNSVGDGHVLLDVTDLDEGLHTLNIMLEGSQLTSAKSYLFLKMPVYGNDSIGLAETLTYYCWFDQDYSTLQSGSFGDGSFLFDVTDLDLGEHTLHVMLEGNDLTSAKSFDFTVREQSPCADPDNLAAAVNYTSALLSWACEGENFRLCYYSQTNPTLVCENVTGHSFELTDLEPGIYYWQVQNLCSAVDTGLIATGPSFTILEPAYYTVNASANPIDGGVVSGGGLYREGLTCTLNAIADNGYTFINWTKNGQEVSGNPTYSFVVTETANYVAHFYRASVNYYVMASANPSEGGIVTGSGAYNYGNSCTLTATPNTGWFFNNWTQNGVHVSNNPTFRFTVMENAVYVANFSQGLPELHVTDIDYSILTGGQQATISWTVQNDGTAATPNGATWYDRIWLSVENRVAAGDNNPILLGSYENLSALDAGEYYTQTKTVNIPLEVSGSYFLFVLTDAYDAYQIFWEGDEAPIPYNPPPYIGCNSGNCTGDCANGPDNRIYELSEFEHGNSPGSSYNDNFFYELVDIAVPLVPDLQVTSIIAPDNFFSGTYVTVTATVSNLGEVTTLTPDWTDALFFSTEPDISSAICIALQNHNHWCLQVDESYQVGFYGKIPLEMFGEGYFFVVTDVYEQIYEHVLNHNNVMMSDAVNVILTPVADLVPSHVNAPAGVSTAENLSYSYKITNEGAGYNAVKWVDRIYLCQNSDALDNTAVLLQTISHNKGSLWPSTSITISKSVALPSSVASGVYYLYVVVDAENEVFEYLYENNNIAKSSPISVTCPDLQISQITAPEQITSGYPVNLSYTIANNGDGIITNKDITDVIYLSPTESLNNAIRVGSLRHNIALPVGQSATFTCNPTAPAELNDGTWHLIVVTDDYNEIHESNENNNLFSHYPMPVMHQPMPDLQPVALTLPEVIQAGEAATVKFAVANNGDLDLLNSNCKFDIYAAWNGYEVLCPVQSQTLPLGSNVSIGIGQTVHFVRSVLVPASVSSACSTFILYADNDNRVAELNENNNAITANASVLDCPLPDLAVSNFALPSILAGTEAQVSFTVSNAGAADFNNGFGTAIYAIVDGTQILCPLIQQIAPAANESYNLSVGGSITFTQQVLVPPTVMASCNTFEVVVDGDNDVLESNENNNSVIGGATVTDYPFNLATQALNVVSTVMAGELTSVSWTVKNTGTCPSGQIPFYMRNGDDYMIVEGEYLPTPWKDMICLSDDAVWDDHDTPLLSVDHNVVLNPNGTYSMEQAVVFPYSSVGSRYLLCVSDAEQITFDNNFTDNVVAVPVTVELGLLPDLRITSFDFDEVMTTDRAYWVRYSVVNEGERVTQMNNWTDAIFIGEGMTYIGAFQVGAKIHHGALEVGESYTDSIEILIPNGLDGDYFLVGFTDRTSQIYEHNNEDDNVLAIPVTVSPPDPCDLIALQPDFPSTIVSGEEMTVSWQLRNIGLNPAVGRVRNAVYLSTDAAWSNDDVMLGYDNTDIDIAPNAQQTCSLSGMLTSVPEGDYYVIVKANILNALNEAAYENNVCVSMLTAEITFPTLEIGETKHRSMSPDQCIFYKIIVGPEYEGKTLLCHLESPGHDIIVSNGLYLSHESVPTPMVFDYGDCVPYSSEQNIIVPELEQGTYYLMAQGSAFTVELYHHIPCAPAKDNDTIPHQNISISTSILNFEILHVDTDHGANTGSVTTKITGAKFDSVMDFRLVRGGVYLPAAKVHFSNSTETYTTFDLAEMPLGTYAMEAELPGGIITIKGNAFTIEEGLPAELAVNIVAPSSVRLGNAFPVNIEYGNIGTTDLNVSGLLVVSRNGHPIGLTSDALADGLTECVISTAEDNANPDVLRPGYHTTKTILVNASWLRRVSLQVYAIRRLY
jgi:subtilase family serine protease